MMIQRVETQSIKIYFNELSDSLLTLMRNKAFCFQINQQVELKKETDATSTTCQRPLLYLFGNSMSQKRTAITLSYRQM